MKRRQQRFAPREGISISKVLLQETSRLQELCRSAGEFSRRKELQALRQSIAEHRLQLRGLARQAEGCQGAYDAMVAALREIALSQLKR